MLSVVSIPTAVCQDDREGVGKPETVSGVQPENWSSS
jgi:hypothetical protein